MKLLLSILVSACAFSQATTPFKVSQSAGSLPGSLWLQEPRADGADWWKLRIPALDGSKEFTAPASYAAVDGQCLIGSTGGVLTWGSCSGVTVVPSDYDWSQTITAPGAAGTHTITLTPGPLGVDAADTASQYWLSGSAGADEAVVSTGTGTCDGTAQASCTMEVVTANSHTGTTTIGSGSAGAQEAINASSNAVTLAYPNGSFSWKTRACVNGKKVTFLGQGMGSAIFLTTPGQIGICKLSDAELEVRRIGIIGDTTTTGIYVQSPSSNGGSDRIVDSFLQNHAVAINHRTVTETFVQGNRFYGNEVSLETANEISNDQGGLYVYDNNFQGNGSSTSKDILYHGPGGAKFRDNWFTGARDSFVADGTMATVDVAGTAVTATAGRFYSSMVGWTMYVNGNAVTIATYVDSTHVTIGSSLGTLTGVQFGQSTGQFEFRGGNFDNQNRCGICFTGQVPFGGIKISGSGFSNFFGAEKYTAISLTNPFLDQVSIDDNRFGNLAGVTYDNTGVYGTYTGTGLSITNNKFRAHKYSIDLDLAGTTNSSDNLIAGNTMWGGDEAGTIGIRLKNALRTKVASNYINNYRTGVDISGASSGEIGISGGGINCGSSATAIAVGAGTAHAVAGLDIGTACDVGVSAASGTTVRIEGMTGTATTRTTAAGTASVLDSVADGVVRDNGTNSTTDVRGLSRYTSGTAAAGFGLRSPVTLQDAGGTGIIAGGSQWTWVNPAAGVRTPQLDLLISKANTLYVGAQMDADLNWISKGSLYTAIGSVTGRFGANLNSGAGIGTFTNHPLSLYTDSTPRWLVSASGMFQPQVDVTYDIGLTGTRVRTIYAQAGEFFKSGSTGASDYVETRKYKIKDATGSTGSWDIQADVTATVSQKFDRDNAGDPFRYSIRQSSGSPVNYELLYADLIPARRETALGHTITDANLPKLGRSTLPWYEIWGTTGDFAGDLTIHGTTTAAAINYTGGYMTGTIKPLFTATGSIGDPSYKYDSGYFTRMSVTTSAISITAPSTVSLASLQNQLTLAQTNNAGAYDPACLVLAATNTSTTTVYGAARLCAGYETASFTDEKFAIQTATGSGTYQDAMTIKNQVVTVAGDLVATAGTFSFNNGTMDGTMKPLFSGNGSIGSSLYRYGAGFFSAANVTASGFILADTTTVGYCWTATSTAGAGSWQACGGSSQWTTSGSDIYRSTGLVWIGSSANNISAKLQVENSASVNLLQLKYTGVTATNSGGGIIAHQGSAPTAADHRLGFIVFGSEISGTQYNRAAVQAFSSQSWSLGSAEGAYLQFATTATGSTTRTARWRIENDGNLLPEAPATYTIGKVGGTAAAVYTDALILNTRTLTPQAGNYTIAGTNIAQTFSATLTMGAALLFSSDNTWDIGASGATRPRDIYTGRDLVTGGGITTNGVNAVSTGYGIGGTTVINNSRNMVGLNTFAQSITFSAGSTYNVGSTGAPPLNVWGNYVEPLTELVLGSGVRFRGDLIPAVNNSYAAGNTSFRLSTVVTTNLNVSGTISAPSGAAALSVTKTVRATGGGSDCTLIFSGGLLTGGTC